MVSVGIFGARNGADLKLESMEDKRVVIGIFKVVRDV